MLKCCVSFMSDVTGTNLPKVHLLDGLCAKLLHCFPLTCEQDPETLWFVYLRQQLIPEQGQRFYTYPFTHCWKLPQNALPNKANRPTISGKRDDILRPAKWKPTATWLCFEVLGSHLATLRISDKCFLHFWCHDIAVMVGITTIHLASSVLQSSASNGRS